MSSDGDLITPRKKKLLRKMSRMIELGGEDKLFDMSIILQNYCEERGLPIFNHPKTTYMIIKKFGKGG